MIIEYLYGIRINYRNNSDRMCTRSPERVPSGHTGIKFARCCPIYRESHKLFNHIAPCISR